MLFPNVKIYILVNDQLETDSNMAPVACYRKKNFILEKINISLQITQVQKMHVSLMFIDILVLSVNLI